MIAHPSESQFERILGETIRLLPRVKVLYQSDFQSVRDEIFEQWSSILYNSPDYSYDIEIMGYAIIVGISKNAPEDTYNLKDDTIRIIKQVFDKQVTSFFENNADDIPFVDGGNDIKEYYTKLRS